MNPIKILLVDDHHLIRTALKELLSDNKELKIIGDAASGEDAIKKARELSPDVILMDIEMPGIGGLEATRKILQHAANSKIIIITAHEQSPYPERMLDAGAAGYIAKGCPSDELLQAIKCVLSGRRYITPSIAQDIAIKKITSQGETPLDKLSEREYQIMMMIVAGQSSQNIAKKLFLSLKTVNAYRYKIFAKLNIENDVQLVLLAKQLGIINPEGN